MKNTKFWLRITLILGLVIVALYANTIIVEAKETSAVFSGKSYTFEKENEWNIDQADPSGDYHAGTFSAIGDFEVLNERNGYQQINVNSGNVSFAYSYDISSFATDKDKWHKYECDDKNVNGTSLDEKIGTGALIVQISFDGEKWVTEGVLSDIFSPENVIDKDFYQTTDIQLVNGCYYRIIVAYEEEIVTGESGILFFSFDDEEYRRIAEVYCFYIINKHEHDYSDISLTPRKELGSKIGVKEDSGYSEEIKIDLDDPHYGWDLGTFSINGYTRETVDAAGNPLFLKNVGNKITLWFKLKQDIDCLNGNNDLSIAEDKDGYDQYMGIPRTDFKKGVLLIRYTDHEGVVHDPVIYTDFLEANTRTGAETRAVLFEEGDYEVALNYEICKDEMIDSNTDYRIFFKFSIRNGNTMVFPFDLETGSELVDNSVTPNGFKLDLAKSRYLIIDVQREIIVENENGYNLDVRYNRPAKDGDEYKEEGIYTVNVKNLYTNEQTVKKFYVGSDPMLYALAKNNISIKELNEALLNGATIDSDGIIRVPLVIEKEQEETSVEITAENNQTVTPEVKEENTTALNTRASDILNESKDESIEMATNETNDEDQTKGFPLILMIAGIVIAVLGLVIVIVIIVFRKKKKTQTQSDVGNGLAENEGKEEL